MRSRETKLYDKLVFFEYCDFIMHFFEFTTLYKIKELHFYYTLVQRKRRLEIFGVQGEAKLCRNQGFSTFMALECILAS